ncbi:hypothetical protein [Burkholderia vietnamiensis]|uniref:hypothetical protein n=1 Tax=Burkholderia vietnamiensis TaxID=60552 RepID=UPI001CF1CFE9|nr:hypothetical protein [Burkholderia vietnamiensis]MCA8195433.1 hypothetical protein [Burkholderia vietnamiensis]
MTCTQEQFERDIAEHVMTIHRDDGADRHITFKKPGTSCYWFEILTWPGALCIRGDCGTYVFSRLTDMFEFFRTDRGKDPNKLYINCGYWCEKLQAVDCNGYGKGEAKRFDAEKFEARVKEHVESHLEGSEVSDEHRAALMQEIQNDVLDYVSDGNGYEAFNRLSEFHADDFPRLFEDCWEWNCDEYTFHFIWNLYAIAWAVRKYDAARAAKEAA